ncbi:uncharacterized protein A4U43_C02F7840 [Asparagus officinalis]|uniref:DYW domain-containing protein n=1 Tax=Asparagus officinalis TaxID=4686 RepID=A0A5P1FKT1_ASPOF|nr:pentatricopeptide repeat-containing protein At5g04780 [Asparagus officinalis]XP_020253237.1 pentatricopeptide repeat-containing protein At5g04780 [Asparagus officinalis]XP_020253238.1 pentatricopeptide repeat-containing protein At5g04780 [Asparagus officinalis]XP_020253240.1 pentatricopeptide repeat-containing protein At5g04780 [Asparagus officinalis]ONK77559.1 uncharacterized protein A4U43_C02F7840 [Asparagus officinalis]
MNSYVRSKISYLGHFVFKFHANYSKFSRYSTHNLNALFEADGLNALNLHYLLQTCARERSIEIGKLCHGLVFQSGLHTHTLTSNLLINLYSKCGYIDFARQVFDNMLERNVVSWNTMISGYTHFGNEPEALNLFVLMHHEGVSVTEFTISSVLCACASKCAILESKQLHALAIKNAVDANVYVGTAILDVYSKCCLIDDAFLVFEEMPKRSSVTWSSMVSGSVQNDLHEEALFLFRRAQRVGVQLTQFTLSAVLCACASISAAIEGVQLHSLLLRVGFGSNLYVASSLIDMYSKCGRIKEAYIVFSDVEDKNIVLWNAILAGFSKHACLLEAMVFFEKMKQMGMSPNEVTYASILSACSHAGLVDKGRVYFDLMMDDVNVEPNVIHYSCMVDVLGRAGLVNEAWNLIKTMPLKPHASIWGSLLGSCRTYGNYELAKLSAEQLFEIEPNNAGSHVLLSNVYATNKKWQEVANTRKLLKDSGAKKEIGKSWVEVKNKVHVFVVGDRSHMKINEIYDKLEELGNEMKKLDYKSETQYDLHNVEEEQKEELLKYHSEKLALAFGLISLPSEVPIRINKNLRICGDCHSFIKSASRIMAREIIVRDTKRFHHFKDGFCSCRDFW